MIKKRNKQQSLAGRIDKLGGPEFENHWYTWLFLRCFIFINFVKSDLAKISTSIYV